ncbi:MAG: Prepilin-type N-terminal cleavage/methylation protein [Verrucomicrobiaceae bacterium]|nr:Prepilin-type N-terminal cleavage/methylation protein [Verrucomicrobiaceae bacterium]
MLVGLVVLIAAVLLAPTFNEVHERSQQMWATSYCRQIVISLKGYASEHGGRYPKGANANEAFRELFKGGWLEDEAVFGCPKSPFVADEDIGKAPDFAKALQPGENHWAMTKEITDETAGNCPLVFENPAVASWPPQWDSSLVQVAKPGRVWAGQTIVIGRNDGSVGGEKIGAKGTGVLRTLQKNSKDVDLFEQVGPHEILNVAR